jgi:hypothetical protein
METVMSLMLAAGTGAGSARGGGVACSVTVMIVAIMSFVLAAGMVLLRPYRYPMDRYASPLFQIAFGVVCVLKSLKVDLSITSKVELVQSAFLVWKLVCCLWVSYREAMWESELDGENSSSIAVGWLRNLRGLLTALWFGGGGSGTNTKYTPNLTRLAVSDFEENSDDFISDEHPIAAIPLVEMATEGNDCCEAVPLEVGENAAPPRKEEPVLPALVPVVFAVPDVGEAPTQEILHIQEPSTTTSGEQRTAFFWIEDYFVAEEGSPTIEGDGL